MRDTHQCCVHRQLSQQRAHKARVLRGVLSTSRNILQFYYNSFMETATQLHSCRALQKTPEQLHNAEVSGQ